MIIKTHETNKALSSLGGLHLFSQVFEHLKLEELISPHLPQLKIASKTSPFSKFRALCFGFIAGAESLECMDHLALDVGFTAVNGGKTNASNTYGDYLRSFKPAQSKYLNHALIETSLKLRQAARPKDNDFILDIDSSTHAHYAKQKEGMTWNYKGEWALDTLEAFDQFGFQYWSNVRPGNTFSANGAEEVIHSVFSKVPRHMNKYARMDSAFCHTSIFNACQAAGVRFVMHMRNSMLADHPGRITSWDRCHLKWRGNKVCEIAETVYRTKEAREALRLIIVRVKKDEDDLFGGYDYYAWVTNIGRHQWAAEKVLKFYRKRGNAENFIREMKNGFDLHKFPCQSLNANNAYARIAAFAYTTMRFMSFMENPKKQHFSKRLRRKVVYLACQVVRHARDVIFRFHTTTYQEVQHYLSTVHKQFGYLFGGNSPPQIF